MISKIESEIERPMDIVFIEDLRIETVIGIFDWERRIRQTVALDSITDTLDYKAVSKRLIAFVEASEFQLVETLAERCAAIILDEFVVGWVKLKLAKPGAVRGSRSVGVQIERGKRTT